jgi:hypothetical protein
MLGNAKRELLRPSYGDQHCNESMTKPRTLDCIHRVRVSLESLRVCTSREFIQTKWLRPVRVTLRHRVANTLTNTQLILLHNFGNTTQFYVLVVVACHTFCAPIAPTPAKEVARCNANPLFRPQTCSWSFYLRSIVLQTHKRKKKAADKYPGLAVDSADLLDFTVLGFHMK